MTFFFFVDDKNINKFTFFFIKLEKTYNYPFFFLPKINPNAERERDLSLLRLGF